MKLTSDGQKYLGSETSEVILTEQFLYYNGNVCWKYEFRSCKLTDGIINVTTNKTPDELIEDVVVEASYGYASRQLFGKNSPEYNQGVRHRKKDFEIAELRKGWIIFIIVFLLVSIFKDWYIQVILRLFACYIFSLYRMTYVNAYTTYTNEEDDIILKKKYEILYNLKSNTEGNNHE